MMRMCRPRSEDEDGIITWWDDEARMQRLAQYCATDVEVERLLDKQLRQLADDRPVWSHTELINDRGVRINTAFARDYLWTHHEQQLRSAFACGMGRN